MWRKEARKKKTFAMYLYDQVNRLPNINFTHFTHHKLFILKNIPIFFNFIILSKLKYTEQNVS